MEVTLAILLWAIGIIALLGRLRIAGVGGRVVTFFGMLFELIGIAILYGENPVVGLDLTPMFSACQVLTPPIWCIVPMTQVVDGHQFPEASLLFIVLVFLNGFAAIGP